MALSGKQVVFQVNAALVLRQVAKAADAIEPAPDNHGELQSALADARAMKMPTLMSPGYHAGVTQLFVQRCALNTVKSRWKTQRQSIKRANTGNHHRSDEYAPVPPCGLPTGSNAGCMCQL